MRVSLISAASWHARMKTRASHTHSLCFVSAAVASCPRFVAACAASSRLSSKTVVKFIGSHATSSNDGHRIALLT